MRVSVKVEAREDEAGASWTALGGLEMIGVPEKASAKSFSATDSNLLVYALKDLISLAIPTTRDQLYHRSLHSLPIQKDAF